MTRPRDLGLSPGLGSLSNVLGQKFFTLHLGMIKCGEAGGGGTILLWTGSNTLNIVSSKRPLAFLLLPTSLVS